MKFKRTKLTALAMSVLMAASVMPVAATESVPEEPKWAYKELSATFEEDGDITFTKVYGTLTEQGKAKWTKDDIVATREATCEQYGGYQVKVTILGTEVTSKWFKTDEQLAHDLKEKAGSVNVTKEPSCTDTGIAYAVLECVREGCDHEEDDTEVIVLDMVDHKAGEKTTEYVNMVNVKENEDGSLSLIDPTQDGTYQVKTVAECEVCGEDMSETGKVQTIDAQQLYIAKVIDSENIKGYVGEDGDPVNTDLVEVSYYPTNALPENAKILLEDCKEDASYTIGFFKKNANGSVGDLYNEKVVEIAAQHVAGEVEYDFDGKDALYNLPTKEGEVVTSKSCFKALEYEEVVKCEACDKELSRETKTAEPAGDHSADKAAVDYFKADANGSIAVAKLEKAAMEAAGVDKYVKVSNTATCTEAGTATVDFLCKVCGDVIDTKTLKSAKLGHDTLTPIKVTESYVAPKCEEDGSYVAVTKCGREGCDEVLSTKTVTIKAAGHVYEKEVVTVELVGDLVVDSNASVLNAAKDAKDSAYAAINTGFVVEAYLYDVCDVCGEAAENGTEVTEEIEVVDVQKEGKSCEPGSITLKVTIKGVDEDGKEIVLATAEKTVPYYSTMAAYLARTAHIAGEMKIENEVEATATTPGSYDEVYYCRVCEKEMTRKTVTVDATGNVILPAVEGLKATATGMNKVTVSWDAVEGAAGYLVLKDGVQIAYTTGATSYVDKDADSEDFEYYWVIPFCKNAEGKNVKGELSNYVWAIGRVVGQVKSVAAVAGAEGVELTWDAVAGANGYVVLSKTGSNDADFNETIEVTEATCIDTAAEGLTFYWVYATYANEAGVVAAGAVSPFAWAIAE